MKNNYKMDQMNKSWEDDLINKHFLEEEKYNGLIFPDWYDWAIDRECKEVNAK